MDLTIITVTWNSEDKIIEQMNSVILACKNISYEQIIVDNGSTDKTVELVKQNFPNVKVIANKDNKGFGAAHNQAAKLSSGRYFLFLNPDMRAEEGGIDKMVKWMDEHQDVGLASCKLVDKEGKFNPESGPRRLPGVLDQSAIILKIHHLFPSVLNKYMMKGFDPEKEQEVDSVRGSFMFLRREIYEKLGWLFDPCYFIWFEDVDTCREVKKLGFKVVYTPVISCVDYVGQSFKKRESMWKQRNFTASMLTYFKKWEPWYKWGIIAVLRPVGLSLVWVRKFF